MKLTINHLTRYCYEDEVKFSTQYLRLTPQNSAWQQVESWSLSLSGGSTVATTDAWGNVLHVLTLDYPHHEIVIQVQGVVELADDIPSSRTPETESLSPLVYLSTTALTQASSEIRDFTLRYFDARHPEQSLNNLMTALRVKMPYTPGATQVQDSAADAFLQGRGVCQDHSHVFLACCRSMGVPARYVSGYVYSENTEHVAMHAWTEAWLDNHWHTFDITNNFRHPRQHVRLAIGRDYLDACPVRGSRLGGGSEALFSAAEVQKFSLQTQQQQQQ